MKTALLISSCFVFLAAVIVWEMNKNTIEQLSLHDRITQNVNRDLENAIVDNGYSLKQWSAFIDIDRINLLTNPEILLPKMERRIVFGAVSVRDIRNIEINGPILLFQPISPYPLGTRVGDITHEEFEARKTQCIEDTLEIIKTLIQLSKDPESYIPKFRFKMEEHEPRRPNWVSTQAHRRWAFLFHKQNGITKKNLSPSFHHESNTDLSL